jgi:hypothetical protein
MFLSSENIPRRAARAVAARRPQWRAVPDAAANPAAIHGTGSENFFEHHENFIKVSWYKRAGC